MEHLISYEVLFFRRVLGTQTLPALFDLLGYNYKKEPIIFDVKREASLDAEAGGEVYLLTRRAPKSRKAAHKDETERSSC